jgi:hypothetical protein
MKLNKCIEEMQVALDTMGDVDVSLTILSKEDLNDTISKEYVIHLLEDFKNTHFNNVECDTCLSDCEDFNGLINNIKNYGI